MDPAYRETLSEDGTTFTVVFKAPKQLLLHPEYSAMVHDEVLRRAHSRGLMPVGQILITERELPRAAQGPLVEGETMVQRRLRETQDAIFGQPDIMEVTGECVIEASLGDLMAAPVQPQAPVQSLEQMLAQGMPDDLSELDGL